MFAYPFKSIASILSRQTEGNDPELILQRKNNVIITGTNISLSLTPAMQCLHRQMFRVVNPQQLVVNLISKERLKHEIILKHFRL